MHPGYKKVPVIVLFWVLGIYPGSRIISISLRVLMLMGLASPRVNFLVPCLLSVLGFVVE